MKNKATSEPTRLSLLMEELEFRFGEPARNFTFWTYFVVVILIFAGVGWLIPWIMTMYYGISPDRRELTSIFQSLSSYAIALAATSFVDLIISVDDPSIAKNPVSFKNLLTILTTFAVVLVAFCTFWSYTEMAKIWSIPLAIFGTLIALTIWWMANGPDAKNLETPPTTAATGGDPKKGEGDAKELGKGLNIGTR